MKHYVNESGFGCDQKPGPEIVGTTYTLGEIAPPSLSLEEQCNAYNKGSSLVVGNVRNIK